MSNNNEQPASQQQTITRVVVTDVDVSFGQMVLLILKFTFACIPAAIVLATTDGMAMFALAALGIALK